MGTLPLKWSDTIAPPLDLTFRLTLSDTQLTNVALEQEVVDSDEHWVQFDVPDTGVEPSELDFHTFTLYVVCPSLGLAPSVTVPTSAVEPKLDRAIYFMSG